MTAAELLVPRYEVIIDYPFTRFIVGDVLHKFVFENGNFFYTTNPEVPLKGSNMMPKLAENMPSIFRKMNWWEKRTVEQMPKKIKSLANNITLSDEYIIKEWDMTTFIGYSNDKENSSFSLLLFEPYSSYIPVD